MKFDKTKIYVSTIADEARGVALKYGFGLEIAEYCTAANMDEERAKWDAIVREKLCDIQRRMMHAPFNELCPAAIEPRIYEVARVRYREAAKLAQTYGVSRMVVHSGYVPLVYFKEYFHTRSVVFWRELLDELPQDFTLLLENVLEDGPDLLTGIVRDINDPRFQLCLDIGHANTIVSDVSIIEWIDACAPYLGHMHIHNNHRQYDTHSPPDDGIIDVEAALQRVLRHNPDKITLTLESIDAPAAAKWLESQGFI